MMVQAPCLVAIPIMLGGQYRPAPCLTELARFFFIDNYLAIVKQTKPREHCQRDTEVCWIVAIFRDDGILSGGMYTKGWRKIGAFGMAAWYVDEIAVISSTSSYGRIGASEFPDNNEDSFGEDDSKDESTEKKKKKIMIMTNL